MAEYKYKRVNGVVWGRMPDGTAQKFETVKAYNDAYYTALDEIVEQLNELYVRMGIDGYPEYPEDYNFMAS